MNAHVPLLDPTVRRSVEDEIERLLALLDGLDPDPDLEPDLDGEPGTWTEVMNSRGYREAEDENLEENGDAEPTLGAPEHHPHSMQFAPNGIIVPLSGALRHQRHEGSQLRWADGLGGDHEREPDNDDEYSMGWPEKCGQGPVVGFDAAAVEYTGDSE